MDSGPTCGRHEAVDQYGEQPDGQPNRLTRRPSRRVGGGDMGKERGRKTYQMHLITHLLATTTGTATDNSNSNNRSNSGSGSSNAPATAAVYVVKLDDSDALLELANVTVMSMDIEGMYVICHRNVDKSRVFVLRGSGARVSVLNETPSVLAGVHGGFPDDGH